MHGRKVFGISINSENCETVRQFLDRYLKDSTDFRYSHVWFGGFGKANTNVYLCKKGKQWTLTTMKDLRNSLFGPSRRERKPNAARPKPWHHYNAVLSCIASKKDGRSMTTFYYCSVTHQSGLRRNTFSKLSYIF